MLWGQYWGGSLYRETTEFYKKGDFGLNFGFTQTLVGSSF